MGQRIDLQNLLLTITPNVYFSTPGSNRMVYPCIVYKLDEIQINHADNVPYNQMKRYQVTVIDRDPDTALPDSVSEIPTVRFLRHFTADNLNHYVFTLYF